MKCFRCQHHLGRDTIWVANQAFHAECTALGRATLAFKWAGEEIPDGWWVRTDLDPQYQRKLAWGYKDTIIGDFVDHEHLRGILDDMQKGTEQWNINP